MISGALAMESHWRSIMKAVTWRAGGTVVTIAIAWLVTGKLALSLSIGVFDSVIKIGAFYMHERIWNHLSFGKVKPPEYQI
jgi:uncharacterized membrane protein